MRKKKHFRINPRNHVWDRFYLVNYVDPARLFRNHDEDEEEEDLEDGVVGGASTATATSTAFGDVMADKDGYRAIVKSVKLLLTR